MIVTFGDKDIERLFRRQRPKRFDPRLHRRALNKLQVLNAATELVELKVPPGNQLEKRSGDRAGAAQCQNEQPMAHLLRLDHCWAT